jgi:phosphatidylinositol-3-phosphatase
VRRRPRSALIAIFVVFSAGVLGACGSTDEAGKPSKIDHVFTIVLENKDYDVTFGPESPAPYLADDLVPRGVLLSNYYATGHNSLGNYITMISGQSENPATQADCLVFSKLTPGDVGGHDQAIGTGCVYPARFDTVAGQLEDAGLSWRAYAEDMGADPGRDGGTACAHPAIGTQDHTQGASASDQYAVRHNPFVYFESVIDDVATCRAHVVNLEQLRDDLADRATTPNYSFIVPDLCSDGHDSRCADPSELGGYAGIDSFLRTWVPRILASKAYRHGGLLMIVFDEAEDDSTACCFVPSGPNVRRQGVTGPGGGRTGAILLSPLIDPGTDDTPYNHYDLLATVEDLFGLDRLGYAAGNGVHGFADELLPPPS